MSNNNQSNADRILLNPEEDVINPTISARAEIGVMNLQIGTRLQFLTYRSHTPVQYVSTLVGMEMDQYLLIKLPREQSGTTLSFFDGEKISIRLFSGTAICTFDSTITKSLYSPLNCLCVGFPDLIQIKKLRREMRIKVAIKAFVVIDGAKSSHPLPVELGNLSVSGGLIKSNKEIGNIDDIVTLSFHLPAPDRGSTSVVTMKAKIRNIIDESNEAGERFVIGTEFVEFNGSQHLLVRNHVYEALLEGRQNVV